MSINNKLNKMRLDIEKMKKDIKNNTDEISAMKERNICNDLMMETYLGSGRWLFTYEDIASRNNVSGATVSRIAEKNSLSRRGLKSV